MPKVTLIILCAGNSSRFEHRTKKQWIRIENKPLWLYVAKKLSKNKNFKEIIITSHKNELKYMKNFNSNFTFAEGGQTRQESLQKSLQKVKTKYVMVTDVARANVPKKVVKNLLKQKENADCIVPVLNVSDTVIYENKTINREKVKLIQTPQLSKTKVLRQALNTNIEYTDDSSAIKAKKGSIKYIKGSIKSKKITFGEELKELKLKKPSKNFFTGYGFDTHAFEEDKKLFLGGVEFKDCNYGFKAHSDGDVLIHSLIDALLGSIGAGDIGEFFPDTDKKYKNADSKLLLKEIVEFVCNVGYEIVNIDLTIIAQKPKINPYKNHIKNSISKLINLKPQFINIKATTSEKMGYIGRNEGVSVHSIATLKYYNWKKK
ncbi:MAG: bifunctional 2-C-methyl-D-erythritol 4-phosphate cytidylyltransferase/2-C-methyl-D-erythritol 2,4-cyclodiphosphate synthase [Arcobacter sp.]|nr:bifunctional 2-C-methyl-D-erythritol 4-phosphate cytidylyltransferase/2-C-methyl-D-erythritol 2,4-cyclodiphosphate synthase [Arcobacter sp.]